MDIKSLNNSLANARVDNNVRNSDKANSANAQAETNNKTTDKVTLTSFSAQVAELEKKALSSSNNNEARIAELKKAIGSGEYQVDSQKVAGKLLEAEIFFSKI